MMIIPEPDWCFRVSCAQARAHGLREDVFLSWSSGCVCHGYVITRKEADNSNEQFKTDLSH